MSDPKDFTHFGLDPLIVSAVTEMGYTTPTPIQAKAIPVVMKGHDVMGAAQTGTGKTAGFALPIIQRLLPHANASMSPARHPVRALILTPTRELADQVADNIKKYIAKTQLRCAVVYGGVDMEPQTSALRSGVEIVVATPGRLLDHLQQKNTSLSQVQMVVLDEADRMLDMGFLPDISRILNVLPKPRQSLMFSATFSEEIKKLAANFLQQPQLIEVARRNATADNVTQEVVKLHESEKVDALLELLRTRGKDGGRLTQVLVFVNAKIECRRLARQLQKAGVNADAIHGDKTQDERMKALDSFKTGAIEVLVATDVAARGLDIVELPAVINYDVPFAAEDYIHRIGRTARAGQSGLAIMLMTGADERGVAAIEKLTKQKFTPGQIPVERESTGRRDRRDRSSRREETRGAAPSRTATAPIDEFFTKPYEPTLAPSPDADASKAGAAPSPSIVKGRPTRVAALLGGTKR
jgi:ATP-dependent RNA helicase RhlE